MRKYLLLLTTVLLITCTTAWAGLYSADTDQGIYAPGPYVTADFGYGHITEGDNWQQLLKTHGQLSENHRWFGSGVSIGWSFLPYFSLEGEYIDYPEKKYNYTLNSLPDSEFEYLYETKSWSLMGKIALPLGLIAHPLRKLDIYGKVGIAYVSATMSQFQDDEDIGHTLATAWRPIYELGIAYNFNKYLAASLSWSRFTGNKYSPATQMNSDGSMNVTNNGTIPKADFFALGFSFKMANLI